MGDQPACQFNSAVRVQSASPYETLQVCVAARVLLIKSNRIHGVTSACVIRCDRHLPLTAAHKNEAGIFLKPMGLLTSKICIFHCSSGFALKISTGNNTSVVSFVIRPQTLN